MMQVRILGVVLTLLLLGFIIRLVRRRRLRAKYSFLWMGVGVVILVLASVPGLIETLSQAVGIVYPPAFLFLCAIMLLIFVAVHFSWELSRLEDRTRILAEELALTTERLEQVDGSRGERPAASRDTSSTQVRTLP
jgi:hypothetical protein